MKKPLCVLLHGYPNNSLLWKDQLPQLEKHFEILNLSLPGSLTGDVNEKDLNLNYLVGNISEVIIETKHDEVILMGHDIGSFILSEVARNLGNKVKAQIFLSGMDFRLFSKRLFSSRQILKSWYVFLLQLPGLSEVMAHNLEKLMSRLIYKNSIDLSNEAPNGFAPVRIYRELGRGIKKSHERRKKSSIPTLFLFGEGDRFILPPKKEEIDSYYNNANMEILPGGHWFLREHAELVNQKVGSFLSGLELTRTTV